MQPVRESGGRGHVRRPRSRPPSPPGADPQRRWGRARGKFQALGRTVKVVVILLLPLLFLVCSVPTGFLLEGPGPSFDLQSGITVRGARTYTARGELVLTSVSLWESRLFHHLADLCGRDYRMLAAREYLGEGLDVEEQDRVDEAVTLLSRNSAAVVGLREAGVEVEVEELGVLVVSVEKGYPAEGRLRAGEVIVSVDGVAARNAVELGELVAAAPEGGQVVLGVREMDGDALHAAWEGGEDVELSALLSGEVREVSVSPVWEPELARRVIGVSTRDYFDYTSGVRVEWEMEAVKGPSAGLMLALSLVNALTPEDITRGRKVAGTGEIFPDGRVGPIGGLPMKIRAAEARGAEAFLYPAGNREDLVGVSTSLRLVPVENLEDALRALSEQG